MSWLTATLSKAAAAASSAAADASAPARDFLFREATLIQSKVVGTAKLWTGSEPPSPALLELLQKDGFVASSGLPGKWVNPEGGDAVRVPWRLVPEVEGVLTITLTRDAFGAVCVRAALDSPAFPTMLRPVAHEAVGFFVVPVPTLGLKFGALFAVGFFAYFDITEEPAGSRTFVVRMGGKFEFVLGISLLPKSLTTPFPQPLPVIFTHNFSAPAAIAERAVERSAVAIAGVQPPVGEAGAAGGAAALSLPAPAQIFATAESAVAGIPPATSGV